MTIKEAREKHGFTQVQMALAVGISVQAYQMIERGVTKNPKTKTIEKIKSILTKGEL